MRMDAVTEASTGRPVRCIMGNGRRARKLTLGLLRGLVDKPEDAPLMERDLWRHTAPGERDRTHTHTHTL